MTRTVVANLDYEQALAPAGPNLPLHVRRGVSALATLLRVFARDGDDLWTPDPVEPSRLPAIPGVATPRLVSGPLEALSPPRDVVAWAESEAVAAFRNRSITAADDPVWHVRAPTAAVTRRVNHRAFLLETAEALGARLSGARLLRSMEELVEHLAATGIGPWVLKAPICSAGRERMRGEGVPHGSLANQARNLFERHGQLLLEPWLDRTADFAAAAVVTPGAVKVVSVHRQRVDGYGRFRGLTLAPREPAGESLKPVIQAVGDRLRATGFLGPFGIDAWSYRDAGGREVLHPLGEINARRTFGFVVLELAARLRAAGVADAASTFHFHLGRGGVPASPATVLPLVTAAADDPTVSWLEVEPGPVRSAAAGV